jgi:hypothetical protein
MLFGETVAVYCENHTEHTDTLCRQNAEFWYVNSVRTSQETHYVTTTKSNRLLLFGETINFLYILTGKTGGYGLDDGLHSIIYGRR